MHASVLSNDSQTTQTAHSINRLTYLVFGVFLQPQRQRWAVENVDIFLCNAIL